MTKRLLGIVCVWEKGVRATRSRSTSLTWARGKFKHPILIYLYSICEFNDYIISICNYAGKDLLLVDAGATLPLAMPLILPLILPSAYVQSLARPALILS